MGNYIILLSAIVFILLLWFFVGWMNFRSLEKDFKKSWLRVAKKISHRQDVIPLLIEIFRRHISKQELLINSIIDARSEAIHYRERDYKKIELEKNLSMLVNKVIDMGMIYQDLGKDFHFLSIRKDISELEAEISIAVDDFNALVRDFNFLRNTFYWRAIGFILGYKEKEVFEFQS